MSSTNENDNLGTPSSSIEPVAGNQAKPKKSWFKRLFWWIFGLGTAAVLTAVLLLALGVAVAYPKLPDVTELQDYRPKLPLRIFNADGNAIAEFGEERRVFIKIADVPANLKNAIIAIEDSRFYQHKGVDFIGLARAGVANLTDFKSQGASTITMQVARNVYLTSEKTLARKIYEILLTLKLESVLTKDQILEIYINQIFLGNRAYGFAAAAEALYGRPLGELNLAELALMAGLPKAPSAYNPLRNLPRAKERQEYVLQRMVENNMISYDEAAKAKEVKLEFHPRVFVNNEYFNYVTEMTRRIVHAQYGDQTYTRGLNVYISVHEDEQLAAYNALRRGLLNYDRQRSYRGPERYIDIPDDAKEAKEQLALAFDEIPESDGYFAAIVTSASPSKVVAEVSSGETITMTGSGLAYAANSLGNSAPIKRRIRKGAVIRVNKSDGFWYVTQVPEVQGALVSMDTRTGAIKAMMGGFDYNFGQFNRATQAWRQPGSSFKPIIYSAALEHGIGPATVINDAPIKMSNRYTGYDMWRPKNADGRYEGPMTMRKALPKSKNMVSIRILKKIEPETGQQWATRFGFSPERQPPYLTLALGTGEATPLQMAAAYSIFANGGYRVPPWIIEKITDTNGNLLSAVSLPPMDESNRAIPERNAFVINTLLNEVTRPGGTAGKAQAAMGRHDIYGKTGTTNDALDAWFVGFQPSVAAAVWIGYDKPKSLGDKETGGGLGLPIWMQYMRFALRNTPYKGYTPPKEGLVKTTDWFYTENVDDPVTSIGLGDAYVPPPNADGDEAPVKKRTKAVRKVNPVAQDNGNDGGNGADDGEPVRRAAPKRRSEAPVNDNEKAKILDLFQ